MIQERGNRILRRVSAGCEGEFVSTSSPPQRNYVGWLAAVWLLASLVAGLFMLQASQILGLVQSEGQSAYTMNDLTRPPVPFEDDRVVDALESWRAAAFPDGSQVDEPLLGLVRSAIGWHVGLDALLFAPAVALVLAWLFGRSFPGAGRRARLALPALYLLADELETLWTWKVADGYLSADGARSGTELLVWFTGGKWLLLLVSVVVIVMGALVRTDRFESAKLLARLLWSVRVQVLAVVALTVLVALPLAGPLDQIPDLLRSAHDESWASSEVLIPTALLLAFSALLWSSGMLIVREIPTEDPATTPNTDDDFMLSRHDYLKSRLPWLLLTGVLVVAAGSLSLAGDALRPSNAVWAAAAVAVVVLLLDLLLAGLARITTISGIPAQPPLLRVGDEKPLEWLVVVLAAAPLAVGGLGAVRAYAPLVLLQSADSSRTVHEGATAWFWYGAVSAVLAPLVAVLLLRRMVPRDAQRQPRVRSGSWHLVVVAGLLVGLSAVMIILGVWAGVDPAAAGAALEAHGLLTAWLGLVVAVFGLLQWIAEKQEPVALAKVVGLKRTPWIVLVVLVPLVAGSLDTDVGYHAVTLEEDKPPGETLDTAFNRWYEDAVKCRDGAEELPLLLVAAPGGGARAAYWTGQVMAGLQTKDKCQGRSVFAASGVSGGSVGLAVWSATADDEQTGARESLAALVGPEALSATVAAMLFRDLPRAFVGIHPYGVDRAAVEQEVWSEKVAGLGDDFYTEPDDAGWRPLLMLNASDIATGCKVLVSQVEVHPKAPDGSAQQCRMPPSADDGSPTALQAGAVDAARFLDPADCQEEGGDGNLSLAAASLLSARFPYVSPSGALTSCGEGDPERLFVADGGYLENSGLHTLLALWEDLEPLVATRNENDGPRIVPVAVLVENHYRSRAALQSGGRVRELTGPPNADRTALVSSEALEQALAATFSRPFAGSTTGGDRWFVIAPSTRPDVSAPLGWSLSNATRAELDCQIPKEIRAPGDGDCPQGVDNREIEALVELLGPAPDPTS